MAFPKTRSDGKKEIIINHSENTEHLADLLNIDIRYNEMTKRDEIIIPGYEFKVNSNGALRTKLKDYAIEHGVPTSDIDEHILRIAAANAYHPVRDWLEGLSWDGESRINEILGTFTLTEDTRPELAKKLLTKWLVMCVAAVMSDDGIQTQGVLTLQGPQGIGKTTWLSSLVPNKTWVSEGLSVDPRNKDDVIKIVKCWIAELGEIDATFRKADIASLKGFITSQVDEYRAPYAKNVERHPRRTCFFGSVNDCEFLSDDQNRRFWVLSVSAVNARHNIDIEQLWAELRELYESGYEYWLSKSEIAELNEHNETFHVSSSVGEQIQKLGVRVPSNEDIKRNDFSDLLCVEILEKAGISNPNKAQLIEAGKYLKKIGVYKSSKSKKWRVKFCPFEDFVPDEKASNHIKDIADQTKFGGFKF